MEGIGYEAVTKIKNHWLRTSKPAAFGKTALEPRGEGLAREGEQEVCCMGENGERNLPQIERSAPPTL